MWNPPTAEQLSKLPRLYETEEIPLQDKIIHLHFFIGDCDWFVAEYDGDDTFFGYVILLGDTQNAEWGYFSLSELLDIQVSYVEIEHDLYWDVRPASQVKEIMEK
ncbi:MAG: DUF2958 domain-containing protein [Desulfovibrionales bacterium]|nr:DUF2958 domain-containing protein [Desulfovibrionales bacterium]